MRRSSDSIPDRLQWPEHPMTLRMYVAARSIDGQWRVLASWHLGDCMPEMIAGGILRRYLQGRRRSWLGQWWPWRTVRVLGNGEIGTQAVQQAQRERA